MKGSLIAQGAEARVYEGSWLTEKVVIKHRFAKGYRHPSVDEHITNERMKGEARALNRCRMVGIRTPCVYAVDFKARRIVMEYIENSITARNLIYQYSEKINSNKNVTVSSSDTLILEMQNLAVKMGMVMGKLHKNNIIHGDLTTSNMLLVEPYEESDVIMIDFGLSYLEEKAEDKAVDLYVLERAVLSTHPNTEEFVKILLDTYEKNGGKAAKSVIKKLDEVRLRGRKKLCFG